MLAIDECPIILAMLSIGTPASSISRLRREQQALQLAIRCHSFMALAVQPALTSIPQPGVARQLATELSYRSPVSYPPHNQSLPRPVQSTLFEVEQHLHFVCLHKLLFYGQSYPLPKRSQLCKALYIKATAPELQRVYLPNTLPSVTCSYLFVTIRRMG